jgi:[ribosomal protein S5]-alanine N-acetyltransferase
VVQYGFEELKLNRNFFAGHFKHNPASGKVLKKLGMTYEGCMPKAALKWGQFIDIGLYSILREEMQDSPPFAKDAKEGRA